MTSDLIQTYALGRNLKWLFHFTKSSNLDSILSKGLLPRKKLTEDGFSVTFNDQYRYDGTDAICASVSFPNYRMFYPFRQKDVTVRWAILYFNASILWELNCAFCHTNAASSTVSAMPLAERREVHSLARMFDEVEGRTRSDLKIGVDYTTDPQAEVLFLDGIPKEYIAGVIVETADEATALKMRHPNLRVVHRADYFKYRSDWAYWKA